ncbi:MAG: L,D-transpeptidase family protein [Pedobacter sp.]
MRMLVVSAFIFLTSTFANADVRNEAIIAISELREAGGIHKMPDEMLSMDTTFVAAEQYLQLNDRENANRYYILTIQKARVLATILLERGSETSVKTNNQPQDRQQSSAPSASPGHSVSPSPVVTPESTPYIQAVVSPITTPLPIVQQYKTTSPTTTEQTASDDDTDYFPNDVTSEKLVGNVSTYIVRKNDSLRLVAAKLGVGRQQLAHINQLDPKDSLKIGQKLKYNNLKIVPQRMKNGIVINIPDRTLYYFRHGKLTVSIPVALGAANRSERYNWKTPTGKFRVTAKQKNPTWHVPFSIQSKMEDDGMEVITSVPPGPGNPLGKYAIKTSLPGILIHSTTKPGSIYSFASHGCIRVYPEHMEELFKEIKINMLGEIIYRPVKLAVTEEGQIFMEVHKDAYSKNMGLDTEARRLIEKQNLSERVNWAKVKSMIKLKAGIAEDISL